MDELRPGALELCRDVLGPGAKLMCHGRAGGPDLVADVAALRNDHLADGAAGIADRDGRVLAADANFVEHARPQVREPVPCQGSLFGNLHDELLPRRRDALAQLG